MDLVDSMPKTAGFRFPMTQSRRMLIECRGFRHLNTDVPAFEILATECVAVVIPWVEAGDWNSFLNLLSGRQTCPAIRVIGRVGLIHVGGLREPWLRCTVRQTLNHHGVSDEDAAKIVSEFGIAANSPYGVLDGTPRVLLGLHAAHLTGSEVVIYSTAGLDPSGIRKVTETAKAMQPHFASIDVVSDSILNDYQQFSEVERIISIPGSHGSASSEDKGGAL